VKRFPVNTISEELMPTVYEYVAVIALVSGVEQNYDSESLLMKEARENADKWVRLSLIKAIDRVVEYKKLKSWRDIALFVYEEVLGEENRLFSLRDVRKVTRNIVDTSYSIDDISSIVDSDLIEYTYPEWVDKIVWQGTRHTAITNQVTFDDLDNKKIPINLGSHKK
jgi:hypothetical protein